MPYIPPTPTPQCEVILTTTAIYWDPSESTYVSTVISFTTLVPTYDPVIETTVTVYTLESTWSPTLDTNVDTFVSYHTTIITIPALSTTVVLTTTVYYW
jgi:hypothetical protein